jgi:hypothetical protein
MLRCRLNGYQQLGIDESDELRIAVEVMSGEPFKGGS